MLILGIMNVLGLNFFGSRRGVSLTSIESCDNFPLHAEMGTSEQRTSSHVISEHPVVFIIFRVACLGING